MSKHMQAKARIEAEIEAIESAQKAGKSATSVVELDQQAIGRLSRMDALQNQAMAAANARHRSARISRLRQALNRIETGEYGYCRECGEHIEQRRLNAEVTVETCLDCARG